MSQLPRAPVQLAALLTGIIFLLAGVLGFVPGITTGYDSIRFAGPHFGTLLFDLFAVSVLHNIVHVLLGTAGLLLAIGMICLGGVSASLATAPGRRRKT